MTDRLHTYSMTNACPSCKRPIIRAELPGGDKITDAEPIWGVVICGPVGSVEPRWLPVYPEHRCTEVKR